MKRIPRFLDYAPAPLDLRDENRPFPRRHIFKQEDVHAINAALAAGRPLLLRGRPGTGKSQLALAAAVGLGRAFVSEVVDARTESRDLLWRFDAVRRLANAQVLAAARPTDDRAKTDGDPLHEKKYTTPGPLWWAFQWGEATDQAKQVGVAPPTVRRGCDPANGVVILLDEIDKADSSVPNGLLGVLGDGEFSVPGVAEVRCEGVAPLVVITTNEERSLPNAFLRRCAVHELTLDRDPELLEDWLLRLAKAHFPDLETALFEEAAMLLLEDREQCLRDDVHPPGGAEFLDLLRAIAEQNPKTPEDATALMAIARQFLLRKRPRDEGR